MTFIIHILSIKNQYIESTLLFLFLDMIRRMKVTITQIESTVTPSGNSGHVVVTKGLDWKRSYSQPKRRWEEKVTFPLIVLWSY